MFNIFYNQDLINAIKNCNSQQQNDLPSFAEENLPGISYDDAPAALEKVEKIPIYLKLTLTIKEASEYSNIGLNTLSRLLRMPNCPFVIYIGTKMLVKRKEFEQFISQNTTI